MKQIKEFIDLIKELWKSPRGKGILFFGFYFIFFLVVIVLVRTGVRSTTGIDEYENGTMYNFTTKNLESKNFSYVYNINVDGILYVYSGKKTRDKELFSVNNIDYYRNGENYFVNNNNLWIKSDNPNLFSYFVELNNIKGILKDATYISKTSYDSGKETYNFKISTNNLNKMIDNVMTDLDDKGNSIVLVTDEDKSVDTIKLNLDDYCINKGLCRSTLEMELIYDEFMEIEDIKSPIN